MLRVIGLTIMLTLLAMYSAKSAENCVLTRNGERWCRQETPTLLQRIGRAARNLADQPPPVNRVGTNCTSTRIGDTVYTNCY